ncbi:MAG: flippase [Lachnospiraceae bacterium]|nr:flippase [Lachnospiraceae bacterium]
MISKIKKNYIYNVLYQVLLVIIPLITIPYLSRTLGPSGIGTVSFAESIVSYFVLFANLGINIYGQREISYAQDDKSRRSIVFYNVFITKLIISLVVLFVYALCYFTILHSIIYLILSLQIISVIFDITWFFQGIEEFDKIVIRNTIIKLLNIIFIYTLVKGKDSVIIYCVSVVLFPLLGFLSLWPNLSSYLEKIDVSKINISNVLKISLTLFLPTIAIQVYTVLDKTMIGIITKDALENGYYEQSIKISRSLLMLITALSTVVIPRVGYYYDKNDHDMVKDILYRSYRFVFMMSIPMCFGLYFVSYNFIPWFLGAGFNKSIILVQIFSLLIICISLSNVTGMQYFVPTKQQNKLTISVCIGAVVNFILNCLLIPNFKSIGAALASVIAEAIITIVQFILAKDYISISKILKNAIKYLISGIVMMIILFAFARNREPSIFNSLIISAIGATSYFTVLLMLKDEFLLDNFMNS